MKANSAIPGDPAVAPVSTGPPTNRSPISRKAKAPAALKTKTAPGAANPSARTRVGARPRTKSKARPSAEAPARRTSEILRQILVDNSRDMISVERILKGLGTTSFGTSIMVFSTPELVPIPVPGISALAAFPEMILGAQMTMGSGEVRLPKALLKRSIPRKALAKAVKMILPLLERAERNVRPRWLWATSPLAKRFLGGFIVGLAGLISRHRHVHHRSGPCGTGRHIRRGRGGSGAGFGRTDRGHLSGPVVAPWSSRLIGREANERRIQAFGNPQCTAQQRL